MAQYLCPFLLSNIDQIPSDLISKYNLGLEAIIFDGEQLKETEKLRKQILAVHAQFPNKLKSIHFPTENANYIGNEDMYSILLGFIDVCIECSVSKIVIHSNYFQNLKEFDPADLSPIRVKFEAIFMKLNEYIRNRECLLLVENIPVVGNMGDDFDSVFVFPEDFLGLRRLSNIGVVWDLGHWAFTTAALNSENSVIPATRRHVDFWEFKNILTDIEHLHLSSFTGIPNQKIGTICTEGIPIPRGDFSENLFKEALELIIRAKPDIGISLEIMETDYSHRTNLAETLMWLKTNNLL